MPTVDQFSAWATAVAELRRRDPGPAFELWVDDLQVVGLDREAFVLEAPNALARQAVLRWSRWLCVTLSQQLDQEVSLEVRLAAAPESRAAEPEPQPAFAEPATLPPPAVVVESDGFASLPLNPRFTFDNFVVGPSNRFPHAAATAVAKSPARSYNPLFLYGGVGLGKTHLMQAIGWAVREANPGARIAYVSGETFLTHFVSSIREGRQNEFRRHYRSVDVWLVDDIQFIASRESTRTEAEFFHTFNALHETNRQIVVSSDRPPKDLLLEDRLRSRFEWGLITDIRPPEVETRLAILQRRAADECLAVPDDVLMYIAKVVSDSVRVLEGSLIKVAAAASLLSEQVSLELAQHCLRDYSVRSGNGEMDVDTIIEATSRHFGLLPADLRGKSRRADLVLARQVAMYLCRQLLDISFADIGHGFDRDHTTVMHACTKVGNLLEAADQPVAQALAKVQDALTSLG